MVANCFAGRYAEIKKTNFGEKMEHLFTIAEVAKKNGLSAKTIQNVIKANPQLGVVMKERVKTYLTYEQAAQLSVLVADKRARFSEKDRETENIPNSAHNTEKNEDAEISQFSTSAKENSELAELRKQIMQLTVEVAVAQKENAMLHEQVRDFKSQRDSWDGERRQLQSSIIDAAHSLESAEQKAARAAAQVDSLREGVDAIASAGFFSRAKMAKELSARAGQMMLEDGE